MHLYLSCVVRWFGLCVGLGWGQVSAAFGKSHGMGLGLGRILEVWV